MLQIAKEKGCPDCKRCKLTTKEQPKKMDGNEYAKGESGVAIMNMLQIAKEKGW